MNNNIYDIDYNRLVNWLLPVKFKQPVRTQWLQALIAPVKTIYQTFKRYRAQKLYELSITPQVCYLTKLLNDKFDYIQRRITIVDGVDRPPVPYYTEAEDKPVAYYTEAELLPVAYYTEGEAGAITDDFVILVPAAVVFNTNEMTALIKPYKLAGTKFKIQIV